MTSSVSFVLDGRIVSHDFAQASGVTPTTTLLNYLRGLPAHKGVKEGCAEGDCGACTVVLGEMHGSRLRYYAVDSCLVFLPMLHGKQVITVENLRTNGSLHPVQQAMVETNGSQCGYCTPGIVMSLFSLYKNHDHPSRAVIDNALTGNLCRCTGYKPIVGAAAQACVQDGIDHFTNDESQIVTLLKTIPSDSVTIRTNTQTYFRPSSLDEALAYKHDHPNAFVICGATDVALRVTKKHELIKEILDLSGIDGLKTVEENGKALSIGAGLSLSNIIPAIKKDFPALYEMLEVFGSQQIRNLATLGGNLGTASPIGDTIPVLMAYNAEITLQSTSGTRKVHINDFIKGYRKTDRLADELIISVTLPKLASGIMVRSYKVSKRKDLDISTLSGGFRLQRSAHNNVVESIRLAYGGMADHVKRARAAEQFLIGKRWERAVVEQAMPLIEQDFTPISDARGSSEFRILAARNLLLKFWADTENTDQRNQ